MGFWQDIAPLGGYDTVRCYPNYTLPGGAMYIYGDGLSGRVANYLDLRTYEPDGVTPITPDNYVPGLTSDYATYGDITGLGLDNHVTKIIRHDLGSGTTTTVRGSGGVTIVRNKFIVVDPEAPLNQDFYYEVHTDAGTYNTKHCSAGYQIVKPGSARCVPVLISDPVVVPWSQWVDLLSIDPLTYPPRRELKDVISRYAPVALSGVRSTARTVFHFLTRTLEQREHFLRMFMPGRILLYRNPNAAYPENNWYISVGELTETRIHPDHSRPERKWDVEVAVVDRPEGLLVPATDRTYIDVRDYEPDGSTPITPDNYQGVYDDYGDYLTILLGGAGGGSSVAAGSRVRMQNLVYGGGRYPTKSAVKTGWSLNP